MSAIARLRHDADALEVGWADGGRCRLPALWLRDHCRGPECRDPVSGQRLVNITDIPPDVAIEDARLDGARLIVEFKPDGHRSEFDPGWLRRNAPVADPPPGDRAAGGKILWRGEDFAGGPPRAGYAGFAAGGAALRDALAAVRDYGFVLLDEVPRRPGQVLEVIARFGYVRETNYGALFEVRTRVDANNLAYTNRGLGCHLDNPYRDPVPGVQLLHCLDSTTEGGESILQDGFLAARILRDEDAGHFRILASTWIDFRFADADADLRARAPLVELDDRGDVVKVRYNNRSIDTLRLPPARLAEFYPAYRHFAEILERESLQLEFRLAPGQLLLFDNTRVLHARRAYSAAGTRHLQGAYSDLDGLYSTLYRLEGEA